MLPAKNVICHPTVAIRRDLIYEMGGYQGPIFAEDYDLWLRIYAEYGAKAFSYLNKKTIYYRVSNLGEARRARLAYLGMANSQFFMFLKTKNPLWCIWFVTSVIKAVFLGKS